MRALGAALLAGALAWGAPRAAFAFHTGQTFDRPPGAGGGGGIFYTGAKKDHGFTCTMCHEKPEGQIKVSWTVDPPLDGGKYTPGAQYTFTAKLEGEHKGLGNPYNYNAIVVQFLGQDENSIGMITSAEDPTCYYVSGASYAPTNTCATDKGRTEWSFVWTAGTPDPLSPMDPPPLIPASGPVTVLFAAVDGDGGTSEVAKPRNDPFNDDVYVTEMVLNEGATARRNMPSRPGTLAFALGLAVFGVSRRVSRRKADKDVKRT